MKNNNSSGSYGPLARVYDRLNAEVNYVAWADFFEECFKKFSPNRPELILDLACGTGRMTYEMLSRGYDMIGVDGSAEMLTEALIRREDPSNPLFLMQDMREFELYGTVGAALCCLDSLNYLTEDGDLLRTFKNVCNYLDYDGLFLFDMNTPYKFENTFSDNAYVLEDEGVYCGWQNNYDPETRLCNFYLTMFEEAEDGSYDRTDEDQVERCYTLDEVKNALTEAGLEFVGVWGGFDFSEPKTDCERWYICAKRPKEA